MICEALGAGLPCVVANGGGAPEMVMDGDDSLVAEDDVDDFTEKIDRLLADPGLMARYSARAVENSARFCPREMALKALEVYQSVLKR